MLSEERMGQIAVLLLKNQIRKKGIQTFKANEVAREAGNLAKEIGQGVDQLEILEVMMRLGKEVADETSRIIQAVLDNPHPPEEKK